MHVSVKPSALRQTRWYEYLVRFVFGGLVTAAAGLIGHRYGPVVGGLFLAFPAIFPASVTLVEAHAEKRKQRKGMDGAQRGISASGATSAGAAMGSIALAAFGLAVWALAPRLPAWVVLLLAMLVWLAVAVGVWMARQFLHGRAAEAVRQRGRTEEPAKQSRGAA